MRKQITWLARRKLQEQMQKSTEDGAAPPNDKENGSDSDQRDEHKAPRLRSTIILAAVALVMIGAVAYVYFSATTVERWLGSLFGPPPVELKEAYSANSKATVRRTFVRSWRLLRLTCGTRYTEPACAWQLA